MNRLLGTLILQPPPEFGFIGGQMFLGGVYERLQEIALIRVNCN